ncbi:MULTISPECIES: GGDEF domain-containing protein [Ferrimonas]|uniref:tetratricopeptide repeat-containing diguanylate cyclase n=1 Tax=Ferrimonas TaxID=44011 RepID=UPI00042314F0|nr:MULTISPECIES: GGDEF domain-containing protein [Ferrimonas]USD39197.1 GGDEF domain-containing protein [Ferrimonas sp. SCSIO 43195]
MLSFSFKDMLIHVVILACIIIAGQAVAIENELEGQVMSIPNLAYESPEEVKKIIEELKLKVDLMDAELLEYFILYQAYYHAVHEEQELRLRVLQSYDWETSKPEVQARYYQQMIEIFVNLNDMDEALKYLSSSLELLEFIDEPMPRMLILHSGYTVYSSLYMYEQAFKYAERISDLGTQTKSKRIACYGGVDRVESLFYSGDYSSVLEQVNDVINLCNKGIDPLSSDLMETLKMVGQLEKGEGDAHLAIAFYNEKRNNNYEYLVYLEMAIANHYLELSDFDVAESYYLWAYERVEAFGILRLKPRVSEVLANLYLKVKDWDKYVKYINESIESHKQYEKDLYDKSLVFHLAKISASDIEGQLKTIEAQNKRLQLENELAETKLEQTRVLLIWFSAASVILVLAVLFVQKQKAKIKVSMETDTLTKVLSRVSLMESCTKAVAEAKRREQPLSLVVFDLDHFKRVNDTFGHAVGDWVLKTVTRVVRNSIRDKDILGRLGGEEFVICLPNTDIEQARLLSERCREGLERIIAPVAIENLDISASFGVARLDDKVNSLDKLLMTADKCLYQAKHLGRNRVATVLEDKDIGAYKPSMGLCSLQAELGQTPLK